MSVKKIGLCQIEKFRMTKVKNKVSLDTSTNVYTVCIQRARITSTTKGMKRALLKIFVKSQGAKFFLLQQPAHVSLWNEICIKSAKKGKARKLMIYLYGKKNSVFDSS